MNGADGASARILKAMRRTYSAMSMCGALGIYMVNLDSSRAHGTSGWETKRPRFILGGKVYPCLGKANNKAAMSRGLESPRYEQ